MDNKAYSIKTLYKEKEEYSHIIIGKQANTKMEETVLSLGGVLVKDTKDFKHYELKRDYRQLVFIDMSAKEVQDIVQDLKLLSVAERR